MQRSRISRTSTNLRISMKCVSWCRKIDSSKNSSAKWKRSANSNPSSWVTCEPRATR
jgi:hypothetical protein